ncbi:MAG TPA: ATP-binding protein [Acidimicrobiia bacterium]|nr:ATP-binding protein [Acidimicrobiia bacterium]
MKSETLRLQIGADPSHLTVARSFVASSLRVLGYPEEVVEDLRLAVSELSTLLILAKQASIEIELTIDGASTEISVTGNGPIPSLADDVRLLLDRLTGDGLTMDENRWLLTIPQ